MAPISGASHGAKSPRGEKVRLARAYMERDVATQSELKLNDIVVSKVEDGHHLLIVTAMPRDRMSLIYRGDNWTVQYAVARGARLAAREGGDLWYTSDNLATLEYLETFRSQRHPTSIQ